MLDVREVAKTVRAGLPADEQVLGAFVGFSGPSPGAQALPVFASGVGLLVGGWLVSAALAAGTFVAVRLARRFVIVARTDRNVLLIENGRHLSPSAVSRASRLPLDSLATSFEGAHPVVFVGSVRVWVSGAQQDEARRLSLLPVVLA